MDVQMRLGQQALKLAVLQFQLAQAFGLAGIYAAVLGAPFIKAGITEAVFTPDIFDQHARFGLPQKTNDLLFAVFAWFACPILRVDGLLGKITGTVYWERVTMSGVWWPKAVVSSFLKSLNSK